MNNSLAKAAASVFDYPDNQRTRRHAPRGYKTFRAFKPWLRDEFDFRCVYCLCREVWEPNGHNGFSVEHIIPRSLAPELLCVYENLAYACCTCNSAREDAILPIDLSLDSLAEHIELSERGDVVAQTPQGAKLIEILQLNRPSLVDFRIRLKSLLGWLTGLESPTAEIIASEWLAFPENLPNLALSRPPQGNERPHGLAETAFERRRRGTMPKFY